MLIDWGQNMFFGPFPTLARNRRSPFLSNADGRRRRHGVGARAPSGSLALRARLRIVCSALLLVAASTPLAHAQAILPEFSVTNGQVFAQALSGSTLYVGGSFSRVGPASGSGVPLDAATGAPQSDFPKVSGVVRAVAPDGAGGWYVGGAFTAVGGVPRSNLAHILADHSVAAWRPETNDTVYALATDGATVYAGGVFTAAGGLARSRIAALDASSGLATSWNPQASDAVLAFALSGTTIYVGGTFGIIGGQFRNSAAALRTDTDTGMLLAWNPNSNDAVKALAVSGAIVYAGGDFTSIGGATRNRIAALNATDGLATGWNPNASGRVAARNE